MLKRGRQDLSPDISLKKLCLLSRSLQKPTLRTPTPIPSSAKRKIFVHEEAEQRKVPQKDWQSDFSKLEIIIQSLLKENEALKNLNLQLCIEKDSLVSQLENVQRSTSLTFFPSVL